MLRSCSINALLRKLSNRHVHNVAMEGFSASNVERYNNARPSYPDEALNEIISKFCSNQKISRVLELGSGTGKFTKVMSPKILYETQCLQYLATEPSDDFRKSLNDLDLPGVTVLEGTGECIPTSDSSVDLIFVAQAFHWMANEECLREINRVLRRGGHLVCIWNAVDIRIKWLEGLEEILDKRYIDRSTPRYITQKWRDVFDTPSATKFSKLNFWTATNNNVKKSSKKDIVDRILSVSVVAMLPKADQDKCEKEILHLLETEPTLKGIQDGDYNLEYRTDLAYCSKL